MRVLPHVVRRNSAPAADAPPADKENAGNRAPLPSSKPVYVSTQPGCPALQKPNGKHPPLQGSKFRGRTLDPVNVSAPGALSMDAGHKVEPLTPRKVGYFCPEFATAMQSVPYYTEAEIESAPRDAMPESYMSTTGLCEELRELNAILEGGHAASDLPRTASQSSTVPNGILQQSSMRLDFKDLNFQERIGENGQGGEVFSALYHDPETRCEHRVAVKRFPAESTGEQIASFQREIQVMALVSSRCHHCVRYWGWCQAADGAICLIMKRYQQSLHSKLDSLPDRKMQLQQVQRYGKQIAQALSELHAQNVLFLDLKPSNILLDEFDNIAVCDFGISRRSGSKDPLGMYGTCNYMSPEAFDQDTYGSLSTKSDVWSFACCIVEMVTGRMPWLGTNMAAVCYKVASARQVPEIPRELPAKVQKLLQECFDHTSHLRPSFSEIYKDFEQNWNAENAGPLKVEPELYFTERGADAYCKRTLAEEGNGETHGDIVHNIPASQLVSEVFRNALREVKDHRSSTSTPPGWCPARPRVLAKPAMIKSDTVRLRTYDNKTIEMPYEVAMRSCTLCWQLQLQEQELGQSQTAAAKEAKIIGLNDPSCTLLMISKVIVYVKTLLDTEKGLQDAQELRKIEKILTEVGEDDIFALLMVANYLDLPELTYLACSGLKPHVEEGATPSCTQHMSTAGGGMPTRSEVKSTASAKNAASSLKAGEEGKKQQGKNVQGTERLEQVLSVPELPVRRHRFDREALQREKAGPRPTRSRSSPAKPHQLNDGIIYTTSQVLSEADMKRMIPGQQSPPKQHFMPGVGMLESITDWGKSSWTDLVQPRFAHAAVPPSPSHGVKRHRPDEDQPIPPKRMARLDPSSLGGLDSSSLGRIHQVSTESSDTCDASVHCTPGVQKAVKEVPKSSNFLQVTKPTNIKPQAPAPEKDAMRKADKERGESMSILESGGSMSILEFRRMIHPDGDRYAGTCKGDLMHGIGVCHYANGDKYYGQWRAGMRHGIGRLEWSDGHMYEGAWRQDIVCPGAKSKNKSKDKFGIERDATPPSPHPLAYRPPMSVHMFRAQLSRMNGEKEDMDPLAHIFNDKNHKSSAAPGAEDTRVSSAEDTRGILTRVVHQTQSVAGVFSGMGDFVMDIMIQSPPPKSNSETAAASDEAMPSARLHFFRLDEDNLVEQEYHSNSASGEKTNLRSRDVLYVF